MSTPPEVPTGDPLRLFIACAPGLEPLLTTEVQGLDLSPTPTAGGVECDTDISGVYRALLGSGLAQRVLLRLAAFRAVRFPQLQRELRALPWSRWLPTGCSVRMKVTSKKSRLYHSGAVAERCLFVLEECVKAQPGSAAEAGENAPIIIHLRLLNDQCTVSLDLVGSPQHERGYRLNPGKAPLREDLARALLLVAGYDGKGPVVDPCCGVGTLPIEAAWLASGLPPGSQRQFALQALPIADAAIEQAVRSNWPSKPASSLPAIIGNDRDATAIVAAGKNCKRSPFFEQICLQRGPLSAIELPPLRGDERGLIVANPPYGHRIGNKQRLKDLYAALGHLRKRAPAGYRLALVTSEPSLAAAVGLPLHSHLLTDLGGTKVRFYVEVDEPGESSPSSLARR